VGREADRSFPTAEIKKATAIPQRPTRLQSVMVSWCDAWLIRHGDNSTFPCQYTIHE
jgi:hypothetical protein